MWMDMRRAGNKNRMRRGWARQGEARIGVARQGNIMKHRRLYDSVRWRKIRIQVLNEEPLCRICSKVGRVTAADTVDHIIPHKDDPVLFYDRDNLQSLCKLCHDSAKQAQDKGGLLMGCDVNGIPIDERHHWKGK